MFHFIKNALMLGLLTAVAFIFATSPAVAQEQATTVLADVSVRNAQVVAQDGNTLTISFGIENNGNTISDIGYAVDIMKDGDFVDRKIFTERLSLATNEITQKEVEYTAVANFDGAYEVWVIIQNEEGLPLGIGTAGEVAFFADLSKEGALSIDYTSCIIRVEGAELVEHDLLDENSISEDETLVGTCEVTSTLDKSIDAEISFETRYRSPFGALVGTTEVSNPTFSIKAGATKTLNFTLPKATTPQLYNIDLTLLDEDGEEISNTAAFLYVLEGPSATIQTLSIDKDTYLENETAQAIAVWALSSDVVIDNEPTTGRLTIQEGSSIPNVFLELSILSEDSVRCSGAIRTEVSLSGEVKRTVDIPIIADCSGAVVTAVLLDGDNNVLAQRIVAGVALVEEPVDTATLLDVNTILLIIGAIIIFLIALILFKKVNTKPVASFLFILLFAGAILVPAKNAEALTIGNYWGPYLLETYTANLDKTSYAPGETIVVSGNISPYSPKHKSLLWLIDATLSGTTKFVAFRGQHVGIAEAWARYTTGGTHWGSWNGSTTFTAPSTPGVYAMNIDAALLSGDTFTTYDLFSGSGSIFFNVVAPPLPVPIVNLSVVDSVIPLGTGTTLNWSTTNATSCFATGAWGPAGKSVSGSESTGNIFGAGAYTYNLLCTGQGGSTSANVTVNVSSSPPQILTFNASPSTIEYNESTSIVWSVANVDYCVGTGFGPAVALPAGTVATPNLTTNTAYGLTCYGPLEIIGGSGPGQIFARASVSANTTAFVNTEAIPVITLTSTPSSINYDSSTTLDWSVTGGPTTTCAASGGWSGSKGLSGSELMTNLTTSTTFTLICSNSSGSDVESVPVTVDIAPVISVTPSSWDFGSVTVGSSDTRSFTIDNIGGSLLSGTVSVSAPYACISGCTYSLSSLPTTATIRFSPTSVGTSNRTATFTGDPGGSVTRNVSGTGVPPGPTLSFSPTLSPVPYDTATTLNWSGTNITSCTASGAWSGSKSTSGSEGTGNITSDTTFTLQCSGPGGSVTESVIVSNIAAVCGNGICEAPGENASSCFADCPFNPTEF